MLDHLGLQVVDAGAAAAFYCEVFAALGVREAIRHETPFGPVVGLLGSSGTPDLWLSPLEAPGARPVHLALTAPSREVVDAVHAAALTAGAEVLHAPREWPEYHPGYYGVFLRDLDGNNVEAVHHGSPPHP
ncbi:MAG TPA: VOC family protein [Modestobacter sp.]|nr:VOC family protein [Modestobacter sp.]